MKKNFDDRILKYIILNTLTLNLNNIFKKLMLGASIFRYATKKPLVRLNSLYHTNIICYYGLIYAPQIYYMYMYVFMFI
jgi:hypothetical protein